MTGHDGTQTSKRAYAKVLGLEVGRRQQNKVQRSHREAHDTRERYEAREGSRSSDGAQGGNAPASQQRGAMEPTRKRALSSSDATPTRPASKSSLQKSSGVTDGKRPKPTDREVGRDVKRKRDDAEAGRDSPPQTHPPTHSLACKYHHTQTQKPARKAPSARSTGHVCPEQIEGPNHPLGACDRSARIP